MVSKVRVGVDFGTSNTVAVLSMPGREPRPLLFDGSPLLPSAVCAGPTGRLLVGRDAWHAAQTDPAGFEPFPKRHIDEESLLLGELQPPVEDVIAAVLRHVAIEAAQVAGRPVDEAVLTYPASWAATRRGRLAAAARAVFPAVELVAEPVAAASFYIGRSAARLPADGCLVVYDFGAGTFDASAVRAGPGGFELLGFEGLDDVGGLDIDAAIVEHLGEIFSRRDAARWRRLSHPESRADQRARRVLWDGVRAGKEVLSRATTTTLHVPLFDDDVPLGREQLDALARPILDRTVVVTPRMLATVGPRAGKLAGVFLVGGSSRMPLVHTLLHQALGIPPTAIDQPELVVAEGALNTRAASAQAASAQVGSAQVGSAQAAAGPPPAPPPPGDDAWPTPVPPVAGSPQAVPRRRRWQTAGAAAVAVLVVATALGIVLSNRKPPAQAGDLPETSPGPSATAPGNPTPSATASPTVNPTLDSCVVGGWRETSYSISNHINGVPTQFRGPGGGTLTYRADGTFIHSYNTSAPMIAKVGNDTWKHVFRGAITGRFQTHNGTLIFTGLSAKGRSSLYLNGRLNVGQALTASTEPPKYVCSETTLFVYASSYQAERTRISGRP